LLLDILDRTLDSIPVATSSDTIRCALDLFRVIAVSRQGLQQVINTKIAVSPPTSVDEGEEPSQAVEKNTYIFHFFKKIPCVAELTFPNLGWLLF